MNGFTDEIICIDDFDIENDLFEIRHLNNGHVSLNFNNQVRLRVVTKPYML